MRSRFTSLFFLSFLFTGCGINTDSPVYPISVLINPVQVPAIVSLTPVQIWEPNNDYRIEFDLRYYITNQEQEFIGYNLYSSTTATSAQNTGYGAIIYLPRGIEPSFDHIGATPSTLSTDIVTQRLTDFKASPSPIAFQLCEKYFFRLQAVLQNGIKSNLSNQAEACAITDINLCPSGSICNP
ncbi:MAG: hypothetical protein OEZ34_13215 [Spirochaetia bacterium]|nr:hypothetical protein [Spirochaetia bacterium]